MIPAILEATIKVTALRMMGDLSVPAADIVHGHHRARNWRYCHWTIKSCQLFGADPNAQIYAAEAISTAFVPPNANELDITARSAVQVRAPSAT
jgi:hypothetical protein